MAINLLVLFVIGERTVAWFTSEMFHWLSYNFLTLSCTLYREHITFHIFPIPFCVVFIFINPAIFDCSNSEWTDHRSLYDLLVLSCTLYPVKFMCQIVPNTELRHIHFTNLEIVDRSNCNDHVTMKHFICLTLPAAHFRQIASYPPTPALELNLWELENWQLPRLPQSAGSTTHWARKTTHPVCAV